MSKRLILIRHGQPVTPSPGAFLGSTDAPLTNLGRLQAGKLAARMSVAHGARCLCSPLTRAQDTARMAGLEVTTDADLREIDFGRWEGLTFEEIQSAEPDAVGGWAQGDPDFRFPGGDSLGEFLARIRAVAARISGDDAETVIAFAHGGVIRALICHFLGLDNRNYVLFDVSYASITTLRLFDGKGVLAGLNDVAHLEGL